MLIRRFGAALLTLSLGGVLAACHAHGCQTCPDPSLKHTLPAHVWVPVDPPGHTLDNPDANTSGPVYVGVPRTPYGHPYVWQVR